MGNDGVGGGGVSGGVGGSGGGVVPVGASARAACLAEISSALLAALRSRSHCNIARLKQEVAAKHGLSSVPKLIELIAALPEEYRERLSPFLRTKPVRSASGVAVVAVMCKPHRCPHLAFTGAVCVYCAFCVLCVGGWGARNCCPPPYPPPPPFLPGPGGPDSDFEYSTQAYTGYEPTSMRAIRARYDPFLQARARLDQLRSLGHATDKVEFIIMGGTFLSMDAAYRDGFIRDLHDALSGHCSGTVEEAVAYSERSRTKCVAITIETRPDYCLKRHIAAMLGYGCTRIEIGVQSIYEDVARDTNRGHTVAAVAASFQLAKDSGYKVVTHIMPDLPRMPPERDLAGFRELFENPAFRPDGLKLYPTLVIRGTGLYELWKTGAYRSLPPAALVDGVARMLALVPPWTRVYRIQRDIPMPLVTSGVEHGNLRELALARMRDLGLPCRDVRTREAGIRDIHHRVRPEQVELVRRDYWANGGWETFLSYEDPQGDILVGLLRLRRCGAAAFRGEVTGVAPAAPWRNASIVRELHVYGTAVPVHSRDPGLFQHQGFGTLLMEEAARIAAEEHGSDVLAVISGVGTRGYYRRLGYELRPGDALMIKRLL